MHRSDSGRFQPLAGEEYVTAVTESLYAIKPNPDSDNYQSISFMA